MIPQFPEFKKLELEDRDEFEKFIHKHPPYSDFSFTSLFSWNVDGKTRISQLNENLVLKMKDYSSEDYLYSFLGENKIAETLDALISHAGREGALIKLIPESVIFPHLDVLKQKHSIEEDRDQHDYVYDTKEIIEMKGGVFQKRRNMYKRFMKDNVFVIKRIDLKSSEIKADIHKLFENWIKVNDKKAEDAENELKAITNSFLIAEKDSLLGLGLYINGKLEAFTISEILHNNHSIMHFQKANHHFKGISEFIFVETVKLHNSLGVHYLNDEQDLGVEGLRTMKSLWRPTHFLKKYKIHKK